VNCPNLTKTGFEAGSKVSDATLSELPSKHDVIFSCALGDVDERKSFEEQGKTGKGTVM
jgi:hypothetical protein